MKNNITTASIYCWEHLVGAVSWLPEKELAIFEYASTFLKKNLDVAPLKMPLKNAIRGETIYSFPALNKETFSGLPGLLADALPDKFGNRIIDTWLLRTGRDRLDFNPVEQLCYTGKRAMGALSFEPGSNHELTETTHIELNELVELAQSIMTERQRFSATLKKDHRALTDILRIGTSAGGARPKALIAMNQVGDVVSGQLQAPEGYDYWILKFDGVTDQELGSSQSFGRIEYAYYLMATEAGIDMSESRLLEENDRAHFITKRFDRTVDGKLHMQTLCGLAHYDYNMAGEYSYEQAFTIMRQLRLSQADIVKLYRRMVFNVVTRNLDDHTKNISFLMDKKGGWSLSPAYDITYAHNPKGRWTNMHQMSIHQKRYAISRNDLLEVARVNAIKRPDIIIDEVLSTTAKWKDFAEQAGLSSQIYSDIARQFEKI